MWLLVGNDLQRGTLETAVMELLGFRSVLAASL